MDAYQNLNRCFMALLVPKGWPRRRQRWIAASSLLV
jgi:hypothetical protein